MVRGRAAGARALSDQAHWDDVYARLGPDRVSWAQSAPAMSLALVAGLALPGPSPVIDVGGGTSGLAGELAGRGHTDVTVLDLSAQALARSRGRLGAAGSGVRWVHADVLRWTPERTYGLWHDRALFHFLKDPADRRRYAKTLLAALGPAGHAIVATFAADGPAGCSGLPVVRYDAEELAAALGPGLTLVAARRELHATPAGVVQPFTWALMARAPVARPTAPG